MISWRTLVFYWTRSRVSKIDFLINWPSDNDRMFSQLCDFSVCDDCCDCVTLKSLITALFVGFSSNSLVKSYKIFGLSVEKNSWDRRGNRSLTLMRRGRGLASGGWLVFRHFEDQFGANVTVGLVLSSSSSSRRRRSAAAVSWGATEGLRWTARQRHRTCAPSRTADTVQTGRAGRRCSGCRCLGR